MTSSPGPPGQGHAPGRGHEHGHGHGHGHGHDHGHARSGGLRSIFRLHSHDAADSIDDALEADRAGVRAVRVSLVALLVTAGAQAAVVVLTGSVALLADTIHNFSDALTAIPLWIAFTLARRSATRRYTYGYGRAEDLAGVFVIAMITLSACTAGYESVRRLVDPQPPTHLPVLIVAGVLGFLGNELVAVHRLRVGRRIGSAALVADGLHARTDGFTSLAVVLGALGVLAGFPLADPLVGLVVTAAVLVVLRGAARDVYRRLMDAVDPAIVTSAESTLRAVPGVLDLDRVRLRWIGHRMHAEVELAVDSALSVVDGHEIAIAAHHRLLHDIPKLTGATVHISPHGPAGHAQHTTLDHHLQRSG